MSLTPGERWVLAVLLTLVAVPVVWFGGLAARMAFTPSYYHVIVVNGNSTQLTGGTILVNEKRYGIHPLAPGESQTIKVSVVHDDHYVVDVSWTDGRRLVDSTGYVTHGVSSYDTLEVRPDSLTGLWSAPSSGTYSR